MTVIVEQAEAPAAPVIEAPPVEAAVAQAEAHEAAEIAHAEARVEEAEAHAEAAVAIAEADTEARIAEADAAVEIARAHDERIDECQTRLTAMEATLTSILARLPPEPLSPPAEPESGGSVDGTPASPEKQSEPPAEPPPPPRRALRLLR